MINKNLRGVAGPHPFLVKIEVKKTIKVGYFSKFISYRIAYALKKNYNFCSDMLGNPEGRGMAGPCSYLRKR